MNIKNCLLTSGKQSVTKLCLFLALFLSIYSGGISTNAVQAIAQSMGLETLQGKGYIVRYKGTTSVKAGEDGVINLDQGEIMVDAHSQTSVKVGPYVLVLQPATIALINHRNKIVKVHNLWEGSADSIKVIVDKSSTELGVGQEAIIGESTGSLVQVLRSDSLARRHSRSFDIDKHNMICSEVHLATVFPTSPLLAAIFHSKDKEDIEVAAKLTKMSAVLTHVTARKGNYSKMGN
jgi:hypothetical protein